MGNKKTADIITDVEVKEDAIELNENVSETFDAKQNYEKTKKHGVDRANFIARKLKVINQLTDEGKINALANRILNN